MKHGKTASKGHAKGSKEALNSKASAQGGKEVAAKSKKAVPSPQAVKGKADSLPKGGGKAVPKTVPKTVPKAERKAVKGSPPPQAAAPPAGGKADARGKATADSGGLRPDIAAAFQRVLKKFPDALRRLAD